MTAPRKYVRRLTELGPGSVIAAPFGDMEGDVAEKTSDGFWLVVGETGLVNDYDMAELVDDAGGMTTLRDGYGDDDA